MPARAEWQHRKPDAQQRERGRFGYPGGHFRELLNEGIEPDQALGAAIGD
jgi:hypothetical protein